MIRTLFISPFNFDQSQSKCNAQLSSQPSKADLNEKSLPKQNTIQNFMIDAQGLRKTRNENPPTREIRITS